MNIPPIVYIGLIFVAIISAVMANISKYAWRSRRWTLVFAITGSLSVLVLMLAVLI